MQHIGAVLSWFIHKTGEHIVYASKYMNDYHDTIEPKEFVIVQEVVILKKYTVEAESMVDAIQQIEHENYDCVIDEDESYAEKAKGRIVSVTVNDDDD